MNHYERLQVAPDASLETIVAAYRALAKRWQPERNDGSGGWSEREAQRLAALTTLNEAFEILRDPDARLAYDHALLASRDASPVAPTAASSRGAALTTTPSTEPIAVATGSSDEPVKTAPAVSSVVESAPPLSPAQTEPRRRIQRPAVPRQWVLLGGVAAGLSVATVGYMVWQRGAQMDVDRVMSQQYQQGAEAVTPPEANGVGAALSKRPTVQELSRLSDEELLKALPKIGTAAPVAPVLPAVGNRPHPLDGKPLGLRNESKVDDPLAPEASPPTAAPNKAASPRRP